MQWTIICLSYFLPIFSPCLTSCLSPLVFMQLRIYRLAKWWPEFRLFLKIVWASMRALRNPALLLVTAGFIFTLVGMQLFQKDYKSGVCRIAGDCMPPRWHMIDFFHTFMVITRTLRGQWIELLWDCMQVSGEALCISFFVTVLVVGYLLVSQKWFLDSLHCTNSRSAFKFSHYLSKSP